MRTKGSYGVKLLECTNPYKERWSVRWDIQPEEEVAGAVNYEEAVFDHKPEPEEIRNTVLNRINYKVSSTIWENFTWKGHPVWLSAENQFNYKAACDLAVQTAGKSLPVTFKFGTDEEPVWYEFTTTEELTDFCTSMIAFIRTTVEAGWKEKSAFDFPVYEQLLAETGQETW